MIKRFGVSLDSELLEKFDKTIERKGYSKRSEAIADIIRNSLIQDSIEKGKGNVFGIISMVYDHHTRGTDEKLTDVQHSQHNNIIATTHVHIDHNNCLEIIIVSGKANEIKTLAENLQSVRGVKHTKYTLTKSD